MTLQLSAVGEEVTHVVNDVRCPDCLERYPEPCSCGGLIHAASGEDDRDGTTWPLTKCDQCGGSAEEAG